MLDTGLCCYLATINNPVNLSLGINAGPLFQTFVVSEIIKSYMNNGKKYDNYFYWVRTNGNFEIDFLIFINNVLYPIEIKKTSQPNKTMIKVDTLNKSKYHIGLKSIICNISNKITPVENIVFLPITEI
jgi:predicted AAA+ superfamily ATPase